MIYNRAIDEINNRYVNKQFEFENSKTCIFCKLLKVDNLYTCIKHKNKKLPWKLNITLPSIRKSVMLSDKQLKGTSEEYLSEIPYDTRQLIIKDAITMFKSASTNKLHGNITSFKLKHKEKSNRSIFWIDDKALKIINNKVTIFVKRLKNKSKIRLSAPNIKKLPISNTADCKILFDKGAYYLVLSTNTKNNIIYNKKEHIALDPGIRTFQTCYDPLGNILEFGKVDASKIKKIYTRIDYLKSLLNKVKNKTCKSISSRILKLNKHINGIVSNLHNQCASFLAKNYKHILLPSFNTSVMLRSKNLYKSVKRLMSSFSFYKFKEKLSYLCFKYNSYLYIVDESYTSKLCGNCGKLNNIGCSKIYTCQCGITLDRDINGARNILLQYLYI